MFFLLLGLYIFFAVLVARMADRRGRSYWAFLLLALLVSPLFLALILAFFKIERRVAASMVSLFILGLAGTASAEWGLYVNRDGKGWMLEQTYAFEYETDRNCKSAARALWATGTVKGVACQEYVATSYSGTVKAREQAAARAAEMARNRAAREPERVGAQTKAQWRTKPSEYEQRVHQNAIDAYERTRNDVNTGRYANGREMLQRAEQAVIQTAPSQAVPSGR